MNVAVETCSVARVDTQSVVPHGSRSVRPSGARSPASGALPGPVSGLSKSESETFSESESFSESEAAVSDLVSLPDDRVMERRDDGFVLLPDDVLAAAGREKDGPVEGSVEEDDDELEADDAPEESPVSADATP